MSFGRYALGVLVVLAELIDGAYLLHMPAHWIAVGAIVIAGLGILTGVKNTRQKDPCWLIFRKGCRKRWTPVRSLIWSSTVVASPAGPHSSSPSEILPGQA